MQRIEELKEALHKATTLPTANTLLSTNTTSNEAIETLKLEYSLRPMKNSRTTFSELKRLLDLNSRSLSSHLSILQDGGLIKNMLEWNENSYSYYVTTDNARKVLQSLFEAIMPSPKHFSLSDVSSTHPLITNIQGIRR